LCILLVGTGATALIFLTEPTAVYEGATKKSAMLVEVIEVNKGSYRPTLLTTGTVQPAEDITLGPLVGGQIIQRSPAFTPGGFVSRNRMLLQIDPSDYRNTLELRKSELLQTESDLSVEMGRQELAEQDLELIGDSLLPANKSLVLRKPQLDAVKATINAAQAAVNQAQLNLNRTTIRAPFDAHVLSRNASVGSQVAPGDNLGRLVGTDHYWVTATVPVSKLQWLSFPDSDEEAGSPVKIRNTGWPENSYREGHLYKQVGALDNQTRLAQVLVLVPDPLVHNQDTTGLPKLMIGSFVETYITAEEITDVVRLHRDYLRSNNTVWVMEDEKLVVKTARVVFSDAQYAYISEGLNDQDMVVTTNLSTVVEGAGLRVETADSTADSSISKEHE
jgi:RND family efflux transporter MFP subunit